MAYSDASDAIVNRLRQSLQFIGDEHAREMTAAWVRAFDDLAPELFELVDDLMAGDVRPTRTQLRRSRRLLATLRLVEQRLTELSAASTRSILRQLRTVVDQAGYGVDQLVSSMLPPGVNVDGWNRVDPAQVDAIVQRTTQQITARHFPLAADATAVMKRELVRGILVGDNPRTVGRRIVARAGDAFDGGLTRAVRIARTEMLDAHRAAAALGERQNADVLAGWIWTSALGTRTCPSCFAMHGTEFPLDAPGPLDHPLGRCSRTPKTKSWRELGFDIDEPPSVLPDAAERFGRLSAVEQLEILGPARFAAWQAGKFPIQTWASRKSSDGWRDSYVARKAPVDFRRTRRGDIDLDVAGGSGGRRPPRTTFGEGFGPEPDPSDKAAFKAYWNARRNALPVDFGGDRLEPHEIRFVERFLNHGEQLEWIPRDEKGRTSTSDFFWVNNGNIAMELKSPKAKYSTIRGAIADAVMRARTNHGVEKANFIIDLGDAPLTPDLRAELSRYNLDRTKYAIQHLWVMSGGQILPRISLRKK